jgi:hypothetical protein
LVDSAVKSIIKNNKIRVLIAAAILTAGVILIAVGIAGGQFIAVLQKAATICLECVGIG